MWDRLGSVVEPLAIGIVGDLDVYLSNLRGYDHLDVVACAVDDGRGARDLAEAFGVPRGCAIDELVADPDIDLVVNAAAPRRRAAVATAAVRAGKAVYNQKPFAPDRLRGRALLEDARAHGVRVGGGPDTFLGRAVQTARALIDGGAIGTPVAALAQVNDPQGYAQLPDEEAFFERGPSFDWAPYDVTALVALLGPVARATGSVRTTFRDHVVVDPSGIERHVDVTVPTHEAGVIEFVGGPIATLGYSCDVWSSDSGSHLLEIYGSLGALALPDMDHRTGGASLRMRIGEEPWTEVALTHGATEPCWGVGAAEMAWAIQHDRPHRASGELAYHVFDVMASIRQASREGRHVSLGSTCERPEPISAGWRGFPTLLGDVDPVANG
jgi:predicted dehydrogenase